VFRRNLEGQWVLYPYSVEDKIHLASANFECAITDLYEDVIYLLPILTDIHINALS